MATEKFKQEIQKLFKTMKKEKTTFLISIDDGQQIICGLGGESSAAAVMITASIFQFAELVGEDASTVAKDILKAVIAKEIQDEDDDDE